MQKRLAAEWATVVVNYSSSRDAANHIVDDIGRACGKALAIGASVTNEDEVTRLFEDVRNDASWITGELLRVGGGIGM